MGAKIIAAAGGDVRGKTIGLLGLTFKPDTDDMREAPSIDIVRALKEAGARIRAFDPQGMETARTLLDDIEYAQDAYEVADGADCVVLVTKWNAFRSLDLSRMQTTMRNPILVDLHNVYRRGEVEAAGLIYTGIGSPAQTPPLLFSGVSVP
jgi:UDPglucose 6-dehydrogenase